MTDLLDAARRVVESTYKLCEEDEQDMRVPPDRKAVDDLEAALEAYEWSDEPPEDGRFCFVRHDRMDKTMAMRLGTDIVLFGEEVIRGGTPIKDLPESTEYWTVPEPDATD